MNEKELQELTENDSKFVKQLEFTKKGKKFTCIVVMDFNLFRKASAMLMNTEVQSGNNKKDAKINVQMTPLDAGDKVLFMGWHSGDEEIRKQVQLRLWAGQALGEWIQSLTGDEDEQDEEKKS